MYCAKVIKLPSQSNMHPFFCRVGEWKRNRPGYGERKLMVVLTCSAGFVILEKEKPVVMLAAGLLC
jgi:hypothetical protein